MKSLLTLMLLLFSANYYLLAQTYTPPVLPKTGKSVHDFIPDNWFVKDSASGDLNKDMIADIALILELKDTINELRPDSSFNLGSPRILAILFKDHFTGLYRMVEQNNTFILRYGEGGMDPEVYCDLSIKNQVLHVIFEFLRGTTTYKFRYQQQDFKLIGATNAGVSGGQFESKDINFSTKKALFEWGNISDIKSKQQWKTLPAGPLKSLKEMVQPFRWEFLPNAYI